jgi:hypothetical protein
VLEESGTIAGERVPVSADVAPTKPAAVDGAAVGESAAFPAAAVLPASAGLSEMLVATPDGRPCVSDAASVIVARLVAVPPMTNVF